MAAPDSPKQKTPELPSSFDGLLRLERLATVAWVLCAIPFLLVGGLALAAVILE